MEAGGGKKKKENMKKQQFFITAIFFTITSTTILHAMEMENKTHATNDVLEKQITIRSKIYDQKERAHKALR